MPDAPATSPLHALCVYAEPLVQGRRVLVIDDASRGVGERLVALGARVVHVYDPSGDRARASAPDAPRGLSILELPTGDFEVREGAFDVAILPDVAIVAEPAALLARVRRLLGPDGVALVCCRNQQVRPRLIQASPTTSGSGPLDYYELFDLVALQFAHVRMIGLVPFVGVALAELGLEGEPEVSVETQLAPEEGPPELFVALASQDDMRLAEYAIVQLPFEAVTVTLKADTRLVDREIARERVALAEAQLRASVLEAQLEQAQTRSTAVQDATRERREQDLQEGLSERSAQLRQAEAQAAEHHGRAERLLQEVRHQGEQILLERQERARLEAELAELLQRPADPSVADRALAMELSLRAAEETVAALRAKLAEVEARAAVGEEQVAALAIALDEVRATQADPDEMARLARLAQRAEDAEARAQAMETDLATIAEASAGELVQLETVLRERGQALKALELEVHRRERMVQELVASLEEHVASAEGLQQHQASAGVAQEAGRELAIAHAELESIRRELEARTAASAQATLHLDRLRADNDALCTKLDALALEAARREGEMMTRGWRIAELEQLLSAGGQERPAPAAVGKSAGDPALGQLQDELDALRQALTQEHEARRRLESGDELSKARAELARQAVLIEQLSRELDGQDRLGVATGSAS